MNESAKISKSSRHSKITGDFAEALVLYWLSKYGFECARVDHTGIDLIAANPHTNQLMGISVKSRSRNEGTEETYVRIDDKNPKKLLDACKAFRCEPYFAVVVDAGSTIRCFIVSLQRLQELSVSREYLGLKMHKTDLEFYQEDTSIMMFQFESKMVRWWNSA